MIEMSEQKKEFWYITRSNDTLFCLESPEVATGHIKATDAMTALREVVNGYEDPLGIFSAAIYDHKPSTSVPFHIGFAPMLAAYFSKGESYVDVDNIHGKTHNFLLSILKEIPDLTDPDIDKNNPIFNEMGLDNTYLAHGIVNYLLGEMGIPIDSIENLFLDE
jgi:hypothetical protein